jgi:hypothetical protein
VLQGTKRCSQCLDVLILDAFSTGTGKGHKRSKCKKCVQGDFKNRGYTLDRRLGQYGLTREAYQQLFEQQNGQCPVCEISLLDTIVHIDHDHATGKVRGLLCQDCNFGLGRFHDKIDVLQAAIDYLKGASNEAGFSGTTTKCN